MPIDFLQRKKKNPFCPRPLRPTTCSRSCRPLAASLPRPPPLLSSSPVTSPFNLPPPQWCRSSPPVTSSPRPAQGPLRHQQFLQLFSLTHTLSRLVHFILHCASEIFDWISRASVPGKGFPVHFICRNISDISADKFYTICLSKTGFQTFSNWIHNSLHLRPLRHI